MNRIVHHHKRLDNLKRTILILWANERPFFMFTNLSTSMSSKELNNLLFGSLRLFVIR